MSRERVPFRVHGPFRHRSQWRLDIFENGTRYKRSFATYAEALMEAHRLMVGETVGETDPKGDADAAAMASKS